MVYLKLKINYKNRTSNNVILISMYLLIIFDYVLTYLGVNTLEIISEANPLMVGFMNLPFYKGFLLRNIIAFFSIILLKIEEKLIKPKTYKLILRLILSIQIFPYSMHLIWIYRCFQFMYLS
jgi:hypothetical protein